MNSAEPETRVGQLVGIETARIVRSHRAPSHGGRWFAGILIMLISVSTLSGIPTTGASATPTQSIAASGSRITLAPDNPSELGTDTPTVGNPPDSDTARASRDAVRQKRIEVVLAFALRQQGKPYRWGQAGPYGYDCSGLVLAAFAKAGIRLPHYTGAIIRYGRKITRANMQRGDIIFLAAHHVGLYLGNGMMIVASSTAHRIKVERVYAFYTARRIIG